MHLLTIRTKPRLPPVLPGNCTANGNPEQPSLNGSRTRTLTVEKCMRPVRRMLVGVVGDGAVLQPLSLTAGRSQEDGSVREESELSWGKS